MKRPSLIVLSIVLSCGVVSHCGKKQESELFNINELLQPVASGLQKQLIRHLEIGGTELALDFCAQQAQHLTDSLSQAHNVQIKRISHKARNPVNKATKEEAILLQEWIKDLAENKEISLKTTYSSKGVQAYVPIVFPGAICAQCHGTPSQITEKTLSKLKEYYPGDEAIGFETGQLRGAWVVKIK